MVALFCGESIRDREYRCLPIEVRRVQNREVDGYVEQRG
jgi:hypothetical protein